MGGKKGEEHHNCKLTDEDVELIRQLYEEGLELDDDERRRRQLGYKGIAARFECSARRVRDIVQYRGRLGI